MSDGDSTLSQAADAVEEASNHKALDVLARTGFAVMAVLHIIVGAIAVAIALGHPGDAEPTGAIAQLADNPWGPVVMWGCVAACLGLALWQASEATLRARSLARKERLAKLVSSGFLAIAYGSVGLTFAGFALGQRSDSGDNTRDFSASLMANPLGPWVLVALGLTILGIGIYFIVKGIRRGFKEELFHFDGTRRGRLIDSLGVTGHVAKGIALDLTGLLFVIAAAKHRPEESTGLDGSLKALQHHPFGPTLLVAIGAGFIAYGIFALIRARFGRM
ncbi:DUF1206 domain-containing protein [Arthrobacter sp. FX8]|jgi:hypothetical protein|uniref:DUF1206 domain-containing protein n=1 Tax=Micrococcaceae TaxID=1268 RepID=UPI000380F857|nr:MULTISPECIES: DUF1206 domain-containing protein [unclassified Arthrobacter]TWD53057.1 uncharacterized protein DUF1206 [Arthrobacter sp. AG367]WAJ31882.1 DUF1206 domain-containing protein [Arthrobacter sp. FX8]BCW55584.1 hypothetical protein StoSoilB19_29580 [Arthrobacter sp. StoSoilB19]BCW76687.1 hypothetical protein NicSoilB11_30120 [Arthrobacter sp. NicSoilB11]